MTRGSDALDFDGPAPAPTSPSTLRTTFDDCRFYGNHAGKGARRSYGSGTLGCPGTSVVLLDKRTGKRVTLVCVCHCHTESRP